VVLVGAVGALVARQLSEVPENVLKTGVGIMLSGFGVFWIGEGAGVHWPGSDLFILALIGLFVVVTAGAVAWMKRLVPGSGAAGRPAVAPARIDHGPVVEATPR
jgi:uncharacterized membrane protein